jgi:hypothetical protein
MFKSSLNIPYFSIRLLTLLSYFLPFIFFLSTCSAPLSNDMAFNKEDAIKNENVKNYNRTDNIANLERGKENLVIYPTDYSLSGIGCLLLYKNTMGKIAIGISIALSFLTLFFWLLINKRKLGIYFIIGNITMILVFIIDSFVSNVDLLYGVWVLLFLLTVQLLTEIKNLKNTNSTVNDSE